MSFSFVRIKELEKFSKSSSNLSGPNVAITPWRAFSQANNPFADPEDISLIFKKDETGNICGYIGALPFYLINKKNEKFAWLSGWRVEAGTEKDLSEELLKLFVKSYDHKIMFSDIPSVKLAKKIQKAASAYIKERNGLHIWLRFNISKKIILSSEKNWKYYKLVKSSGIYYLLNIFEKILNLILYPLYYLASLLPAQNNLIMEKINFPGEEDLRFIHQNAGKDVGFPDIRVLKWYKDFPWLIMKDRSNAFIGLKYYFSSFADKNELFWLRIREDKQLVGLVCLSVRDGVVRTQFVYLLSEKESVVCKKVISYILRKFYITDIISFHNNFVISLNKMLFPYIRKKSKKRFYGISKKLLQFIENDFTMQDGAGDYIFT